MFRFFFRKSKNKKSTWMTDIDINTFDVCIHRFPMCSDQFPLPSPNSLAKHFPAFPPKCGKKEGIVPNKTRKMLILLLKHFKHCSLLFFFFANRLPVRL